MEQVATFDRTSAVMPPSGHLVEAAIPISRRPRFERSMDQPAGSAFALLQAILDKVHFGVAVVGAEFRLLFANQAARRECKRCPRLRIEAGRLVFDQVRQERDFHRAFDAARAGRWSLVQMKGDHDDTLLALIPISPIGADGDASVLLVFGLRSPDKGLAIQFYAKACGMTATEERVLAALSDGLTPHEIACRHAVAISTIRTQLGSIRSKTGACSLTDLMRTVGCLPPIMPAALSVT